MKWLICWLLLTPVLAWAQPTEGKIIYQHNKEITFDKDRFGDMPEDMQKRIKERMKKAGKGKRVLVFTPSQSLYRNFSATKDAKDETDWEQAGGRGGRGGGRWRMMRPQSRIWQSIGDYETINQTEFFDKKFLISGLGEQRDWKITGKSEKVLDYICQEAIYQKDDTTTVTAWFTPQIPIPAGPNGISALPGMVLKVDINNGEETMEALSVELRPMTDEPIEKPEKGKAVTEEEFKEIVEAKRQEMREMRRSQGGR